MRGNSYFYHHFLKYHYINTMSTADQQNPTLMESPSEEIVNMHDPEASDQEVEVPEIDYSGFNKKDFSNLLKALSQETDILKADKQLRLLKPFLDDLREHAREEALNRFIADGGKAEDFTMRKDDHDLVIDGSIKLIREKRFRFNKEQEESRKQNLSRKQELLIKFREVVEREDTKGSFQEFKKLQEEWRKTGAVPQAFNKEIWASYHALVDRFFDQRNIFFELLDLDRRKNLDAKKELCLKAEQLTAGEKEKFSLAPALREINELHQEWKHIGPVPNEEKEQIWQRFRTASAKVYERRDEHLKDLNSRFAQNRKAKMELLEKVGAFKDFESTSIKDWNVKSAEAVAIQQAWATIGPVERSRSKEINRQFWSGIKSFYLRKGKFFKQLDAGRQENLNKKRALIEEVNALRDSGDLNSAINRVKQIQSEWKQIGPVPEKVNKKVFAEFKSACDYFFDLRRNASEEAGKAHENNLQVKLDIIDKIKVSTGIEMIESVKELVKTYYAAGFVPKNRIDEVQKKFEIGLNAFLTTLPTENNLRDKTALEMEMLSAPSDPNAARRIQQQEIMLRKKLIAAENELALLRNNLEFFARSKNADAVREEFRIRIEAAEAEVTQVKTRLRLIRSTSLNSSAQ